MLHCKVVPNGPGSVSDEVKGCMEAISGEKVVKKVIECFLSEHGSEILSGTNAQSNLP